MEGATKIVVKTGISGIFLGGGDPQGSGKNWDLWDFFGGGTTKILVKTGISGNFVLGGTPKIVVKTGISGNFVWEVPPR